LHAASFEKLNVVDEDGDALPAAVNAIEADHRSSK
jgi:hypothetical protein